MFRIIFALAIVIATAALVAFAPVGVPIVVLIGGICAVAVVAFGPVRDSMVKAPAAQPARDQTVASVIESITEPVLLVEDGRVRVANTGARVLLGAHVVGEDVRLAIRHPAAAERLTTTAPDGAIELVGLGGGDQRVLMQVSTLAPGRRLIHLIDRTTNFAAERARVDFVANSSHELRTPLAAIIGFIETLDDEDAGADAEVRQRFLAVMMKEARRMQRLIDDLISLSRIEAEKYSLPATPVDLRDLVREVAAEIRDGAGDAPRNIALDFADDLPPIAGDRSQLSQIVHNLVGNALKYGRPGEPVTIQLHSLSASLLRMSVIDKGEGIPAAHLPRLTERFYRVDPSRSRNMGGTGLGLAIVKHIVERHRGRLEITSTVGTGTNVSVFLPTTAQAGVTEVSHH
ncbi:MAG: ATP-binding protein [Sphingomonadales bacterium]